MVKVTMDQIIAFRNNGDFFADTTLPLKGAYKLNKIKKAVEKESEFYTEKFQEIVEKYEKINSEYEGQLKQLNENQKQRDQFKQNLDSMQQKLNTAFLSIQDLIAGMNNQEMTNNAKLIGQAQEELKENLNKLKEQKLEDAIKHGNNGIDCLNRGTKVPYPTAILGSENMAKVFETLRKQYEYIIVDCPPILAVSDAAIVSKLCDGCVFVISQTKTERAAARESVKILRDNGVQILGAVFTNISARSSYYYSSKYKYYYQNYYGKDFAPDKNNNNPTPVEDKEDENK